MKKLLKIVAVMAFALSSIAIGAPALAAGQGTCDIGYTGPDSNNMCTSTTSYQCSVHNTNQVTITNDSHQVVASGTVTTSGNTTGGTTVSGSVSNSNGGDFTVTITNSGISGQGGQSTCTATAVVPAKPPVTPATPSTPSSGSGAVAVPVQKGNVKALPLTGTDATLAVAGWVAAVSSLLAALSVAGVLAYRKR